MILSSYITDLLFRYDCVIVPEFGGFVTNKIGAKVNNHTFSPPTKQISFNSNLRHNDGLLVNYIASSQNISFEKASTAISLAVIKWQNELQTNAINLDGLGRLSLNESKQFIFEPNTTTNYLSESFGLETIASIPIKRNNELVKPLVPIHTKEEKRKMIPAFIKYAATAAILLTLGYTGYTNYQQKEGFLSQQKVLDQKIQTATFVISNPLPTIELNVTQQTSKNFHIIAGAFRFEKNAKKKVRQLRKKGYNPAILGKNERDLFIVAYDSFATIEEARNELEVVKRILFDYEAWLLIKEFK